MLKRVWIVCAFAAMMLAALAFPPHVAMEEAGDRKLPTEIPYEPAIKLAKPSSGTNICVMYGDGSGTLKEMKDASDLIIKGRVTGQELSGELGLMSTVEMTEVYKGTGEETIRVLQLAKDGVLAEGVEYILFLGRQEGESNGEYYVKGGLQGIFRIDGDKLLIYDKIMREDFAAQKSRMPEKDDVAVLEAIVRDE